MPLAHEYSILQPIHPTSSRLVNKWKESKEVYVISFVSNISQEAAQHIKTFEKQLRNVGNLTFLVFLDLAILTAFSITFETFFAPSFPGVYFSSGLWKWKLVVLPGSFFSDFLLCRLKCARFNKVSSRRSW